MTSVIDSTAQFEARLREANLTPEFIRALNTHGVTTLSHLAFALGQPGQAIADNTVENFVQAALGRVGQLNEITALKRIAFEAQTYLVATLRQNVERGEDQTRKIAFAERNTRLAALRAALTGISIQGEHEPSHSLLDRACGIYDSNSLKYLELSTCTSRTQEVQGTSKNKELTLERGSLIVKSSEDKTQCATDSEIKIHYAMVRRGLALQFSRLMSYAQHTEWETWLFESIHREPPPGYARPSLAQVLQCDKAAWSRLTTTVTDVRQTAAGQYPLGVALLAMRNDPNIALYLAPLAKPASNPSAPSS